MSLVRIAARIAAVEALKGKTLVGDNVLDSEIGAIDVRADGNARTDEEKAFIAVYTDAGSADVDLRSLNKNGVTDFLFEAGITAAMTDTDPETGAKVIFPGVPATDRAFEFYLDMVMHQIGAALTDPANEWAEVFRALAPRFVSTKRTRTSSDTGGVRMAAQQVAVQVDLIPDPVRGMTLASTHGLAKFFAKAEELASPAIAAQVAMMHAAVGGTVSDFDVMRARYGRTEGEGAASGLEVQGTPITAVQLGSD